MGKWHLFMISIGLLLIASSPMFQNQTISIIMGIVLILIAFILMKRKKKE